MNLSMSTGSVVRRVVAAVVGEPGFTMWEL
jgi:hypothetical protein